MNMDKKNRYMPKQSGLIVECNDPEEQSTYYKRLNCQETTKNIKKLQTHSSSKQKTQKNTVFQPTPPPFFQPSCINPMDFHLKTKTSTAPPHPRTGHLAR